MKLEYTIAWAVWLTLAVAAEIVGVQQIVWLVLLLMLAGIEAVAVARRKPGDTASENVWAWVKSYPGRATFAACMGLWLSWHIYLLTPGGVGPGLMCAGFASWLVPHFATTGRTG